MGNLFYCIFKLYCQFATLNFFLVIKYLLLLARKTCLVSYALYDNKRFQKNIDFLNYYQTPPFKTRPPSVYSTPIIIIKMTPPRLVGTPERHVFVLCWTTSSHRSMCINFFILILINNSYFKMGLKALQHIGTKRISVSFFSKWKFKVVDAINLVDYLIKRKCDFQTV